MGKDAPAKAATEQQTIAQAQAAALAALDQAAKRTVRYGHARAGAYYHLKRANETLLKGRDFAGLKGQGQAFFWAKKSCPSDHPVSRRPRILGETAAVQMGLRGPRPSAGPRCLAG